MRNIISDRFDLHDIDTPPESIHHCISKRPSTDIVTEL